MKHLHRFIYGAVMVAAIVYVDTIFDTLRPVEKLLSLPIMIIVCYGMGYILEQVFSGT